MKLKIFMIIEPIGFSILGKLHIGAGMVLGYFIFFVKYWDGFKLFF